MEVLQLSDEICDFAIFVLFHIREPYLLFGYQILEELGHIRIQLNNQKVAPRVYTQV